MGDLLKWIISGGYLDRVVKCYFFYLFLFAIPFIWTHSNPFVIVSTPFGGIQVWWIIMVLDLPISFLLALLKYEKS